MLEPERPPVLLGGFIMSPSTHISAMVVIAHAVACSRDCVGYHGLGLTAGVANAKRRYAVERGGESSVLGLVVVVMKLVLV